MPATDYGWMLYRASFVANRLSDSQKQELVKGYRSGESTAALAKYFGCSQNTVIRTVKAALPLEEYNALKAIRSRSDSQVDGPKTQRVDLSDSSAPSVSSNSESVHLNLDVDLNTINDELNKEIDIDLLDISNNDSYQNKDNSNFDPLESNSDDCVKDNTDVFHEIVPLASELDESSNLEFRCLPFSEFDLPQTVYLLVDRSVELEPKPLSDFKDLGDVPEEELSKKAISLFSSQRTAKRQCSRGQRVIKVPDTNVFEISKPFLINRGITRLVLEGKLISLDPE